MAKFSSQVIAAHQSAMNFATCYMLSQLAFLFLIVISYEIGANRPQQRVGMQLSVV